MSSTVNRHQGMLLRESNDLMNTNSPAIVNRSSSNNSTSMVNKEETQSDKIQIPLERGGMSGLGNLIKIIEDIE